MLLRAALESYRAQKALTMATTKAGAGFWSQVKPTDLTGSYEGVLGGLLTRLIASQLLAARIASEYVPRALAEQSINADADARLNERAFTEFASDGRDLSSLLLAPLFTTKLAIAQGLEVSVAMQIGGNALTRILGTQVADAGRNAESVAMATRPRCTSWVRMLQLPSCSRCALLAGRTYRWSDGFKRHPLCDCRHIPSNENSAGDLTTDTLGAIKAGHVTGLSLADTKAIVDDGADVSQVINAQCGMNTASAFGRQLKSTTEGTTVRGQFGKNAAVKVKDGGRYRRAAGIRLRPEEIYKQANGDRAEALRLLKRFGYVS